MNDRQLQIGDRVRMVQTHSLGTIQGVVRAGVGLDGTDRVAVKWDSSGSVTEWNPDFMSSITSRPENDLDEVVCGGVRRRKLQITITQPDGVVLIVPEGFSRV